MKKYITSIGKGQLTLILALAMMLILAFGGTACLPAYAIAEEEGVEIDITQDDPEDGWASPNKQALKAKKGAASGAKAVSDTEHFTVDNTYNSTAGFVTFKAGGLEGSCIQKGVDYENSGTAEMSKKSNNSLLAKAAYYVDIQKGWFKNHTDRPAIMDQAGVGSRFRAGLLAEDVVQCANQGVDTWSSRAASQSYPQMYIDYVVDIVENTLPGVTVPDNFVIYKGSPSDGSQDFAVWELIPDGYFMLKKTAAGTSYNFPSSRSLAGAVYYVYTDSGCTTRAKDSAGSVITLTTNASGNTAAVAVTPATYYVKEITPSTGYLLDTTVRSVTVSASNTADNPAVVTSSEPIPKGYVGVKKRSGNTDITG